MFHESRFLIYSCTGSKKIWFFIRNQLSYINFKKNYQIFEYLLNNVIKYLINGNFAISLQPDLTLAKICSLNIAIVDVVEAA